MELSFNELRIGNLVSHFGFIHRVEAIHSKKKLDDKYRNIEFENGVIDFLMNVKPIPLTEEWHNKFGIGKNGFNSFQYFLPIKNNIDVQVIFNGDYVMIRQGKGNNDDDIISIWNKDLTKRDMFVHEWQNLYFLLTGEELLIDNKDLLHLVDTTLKD